MPRSRKRSASRLSMRSKISSDRACTVIALDVSDAFGKRSTVRALTPRRASSSVSIVPAAPPPTTRTGTSFISPPFSSSPRSVLAARAKRSLDLLRVGARVEKLIDVDGCARCFALFEPGALRKQLEQLRLHGIELRKPRLQGRQALARGAAVESLADGTDFQPLVGQRIGRVDDARAVEVVRHGHEHSVGTLIGHDVVAAGRALCSHTRASTR